MDLATQVQILSRVVTISHSTNTLGEGMNPTILLLAMGKLVWQPILKKENSKFKLVVDKEDWALPGISAQNTLH